MKIKTRLYLSSAILVCLVGIVVFIITLTADRVDKKSKEHKLFHAVDLAISQLDIITYEYLMYYEKRMEQQWHLKYDSTVEILAAAAAAEEEEEERELVESIHADFTTLADLFSRVTVNHRERQELIQGGVAQKEIDAAIRLEKRLVAQLLVISQSIMTNAHRLTAMSMAELIEIQGLARRIVMFLGVIFVVFIVITVLVVTRAISESLGKLTKGVQMIGKGNLEHQIDVKARDEIGEISTAFNQMTKDLKDTAGKLAQSERLATLGQLSGSISHELRNPLGVIDSSAYYLKRRLRDVDEKVQAHLGRIRSGVERATGIIESLLSLTQMKAPRLERFDLTALTSEAIRTSKVPATINVIDNFPEPDILIHADREQLRMTFQNIINNAVQAMDSKGTLTVTVSEITGTRTEVSFADTGSGIALEDLNRIFEPLFSSRARGIGLGLSIAKMIIDKHNGTIEAKSELGKGTIFIIRLPLYVDEGKQEQNNAQRTENTGC